MTLFERGIVAHLIADWPMQNHWIAENKANLLHPAAWIHAAIHAICLGFALGWIGGLILAIIHLLVDSRLPLRWWQKNVWSNYRRASWFSYSYLDRSGNPYCFYCVMGADKPLYLTLATCYKDSIQNKLVYITYLTNVDKSSRTFRIYYLMVQLYWEGVGYLLAQLYQW